jgi:hypothetical protein
VVTGGVTADVNGLRKAGRRGWQGVAGICSGAAGLGGVGGGREGRQVGPTWQRHEREREKTSQAECANQRRKRNLVSAPRVLGLSGPSEGAVAYDGRAGRRR